MRSRRRAVAPLLAVAALAHLAAPTRGGEEEAPEIGAEVGPLRFVDVRYLPRSLADLEEHDAYVLVFTTTECPIAQRYLGRLSDMEREYRERGVAFLSVNVGPKDTIADVADQKIDQDLAFPCVKDFDRSVVEAVGATRTPEAVVLDAERRLRYRGRVDDQYRFGGVRPEPSRHDLREALEDVLAGREVRAAETQVDGCLISPPREPDVEGDVTFTRDVAPILQEHCVECHRPNTEAPFPLRTYEDAYTVSDMIAEVVQERRMPPWFASRKHGDDFANRRGLSRRERDVIRAWVDRGAPEGDPDDMPPQRELDTGRWRIGEPDLVVRTQETFELPAEGYVPYKYALIPYEFPRDTWVQRIQILPENPRVLHHCNLAYVLPGQGFTDAHFLTGKVPGSGPMKLDYGVAQMIPEGAHLVLQIHYVTTGKPETDRLSVGFRFPREPVEKTLRHLRVGNRGFEIPARAPHHEVRASRTLPTDADVVGYFAHMHLRGQDMTFRAHPPEGESEVVLRIPNYNFDWQLGYEYGPEGRRFPAGTRFECVGHYDNSPWNPYNPDPSVSVRWGEQTYHEMFYGFVFYTDPAEELGLTIDPETGGPVEEEPEVDGEAEEEPAGERRYY